MQNKEAKIKDNVRKNYSKVVEEDNSGGCCSSSCCGSSEKEEDKAKKLAEKMDYNKEELDSAFAESNYGLGCGNPGAIANLKKGETVLDLGSGAGFDVFLAARKVGKEGRVIGIDMTEAMINKARNNAQKNNVENVEFILGEIEDLPLADNSVDVIISNCVINLSPNKAKVFAEAKRVLKNGGRLAISDILKAEEFPEELKANLDNYSSCVTGSIAREKLISILEELEFKNIEVERKSHSDQIVEDWISGVDINNYIYSAYIRAEK
ncbi:methyltransferase family protein [Halanaerobium saccharolyticum]|uniref:Arsenite methyltransferase n=1 Tax=Halanaerobium saccharolyticum TaxID=43595 RepID=A0A4R6LN74_9FIRM|nr:arsenite methyltransferase [Halanaerobium saccharolyticum]TDO85906.1 methyltransferase family protein [Halanaerobium saccharolyticum]